MFKGVRKIHAVAVSHPHPDHLYGFFAVLRNFYVEEVWVASPTSRDERYTEFDRLVIEKGIRERILHPGDQISIGPAIRFFSMHPSNSKRIYSPRGENSWINNHSMVLKIVYGEISILFTGDIEKEAERYLVKKLPKGTLSSTILKSPHHGSKNSNSLLFMEAVKPEVTVISTRQSSWHPLPAPSTIKRMETLPSRIYRTDRDGTITLSTDGKGYCIQTWLEYQSLMPVLRIF